MQNSRNNRVQVNTSHLTSVRNRVAQLKGKSTEMLLPRGQPNSLRSLQPPSNMRTNSRNNRVQVNTSPLTSVRNRVARIESGNQRFVMYQQPPQSVRTNTNKPLENDRNNLTIRENAARKRLRNLDDRKFELIRQKRRIIRNRTLMLERLNGLKKNKATYIRDLNQKTRQNAQLKYNKNIQNLQSRVNKLSNTKQINDRLAEIQRNTQRSDNKKLLQGSMSIRKPTLFNRMFRR